MSQEPKDPKPVTPQGAFSSASSASKAEREEQAESKRPGDPEAMSPELDPAANEGAQGTISDHVTAPPGHGPVSGPLIPGVSFPPELKTIATGQDEVVLGNLVRADRIPNFGTGQSYPDDSLPGAVPEVAAGEDEVVLDEIGALDVARSSSSRPPPLGYAEEHDAWTVDRMSQKNTMRPAAAEVDRLVELSSARMSDFPEELTPGSPLDLVDHARPSQELDLLGQMQELHALDDLTGALAVAELLLGREPGNVLARECAEDCRARLVALYTSKLGRMDAPVVVALGDAELRWLGLDHRSGFLLSRVDGLATVDELLDICGMPRLEALRTLVDLLERGAIRI